MGLSFEQIITFEKKIEISIFFYIIKYFGYYLTSLFVTFISFYLSKKKKIFKSLYLLILELIFILDTTNKPNQQQQKKKINNTL